MKEGDVAKHTGKYMQYALGKYDCSMHMTIHGKLYMDVAIFGLSPYLEIL